MSTITKIYQGRQPVRRHFLGEWLEARHLSVSDLLALLNDDERSMDLPRVDKSQVYRWLRGQMPQSAMQARLAAALELDDPGSLLRHPDDDWFAEFFAGRSRDEIHRMKLMLEAAFPRLSRDRA